MLLPVGLVFVVIFKIQITLNFMGGGFFASFLCICMLLLILLSITTAASAAWLHMPMIICLSVFFLFVLSLWISLSLLSEVNCSTTLSRNLFTNPHISMPFYIYFFSQFHPCRHFAGRPSRNTSFTGWRLIG